MRKLFALLLIMLSMEIVQAQNLVQSDPNVRIGKLQNGLTYYISHNNWPKNRADFFIAQKVGSINEDDNQRGLAHFLEHMCFNGSRHFEGNGIIAYLESIGVKFGENLNAYTSTDETVYNICNVPTKNEASVDSCLMILADWSHDLTLDPKEIDKERGVIENEARYRSSAIQRILEKNAEQIYQGSRYAYRMPIGLMSVIQDFKYQELRDYYDKWYHPANQGIIIVGDVDVDHVEKKIHEYFDYFSTPKDASPIVRYGVPANKELICVVDKDKEHEARTVQIYFKHNDIDSVYTGTVEEYQWDYKLDMIVSMLKERLQEFNHNTDAPFITIGSRDRSYFAARWQRALMLTALSKPGKQAECVQFLAREMKRALQFGFTDTEYARAKKRLLSQVDHKIKNRNRRSNTNLAKEYYANFLYGKPIPSPEEYDKIIRSIMDEVKVEDINNTLKSIVSDTDENVVIVSFNPDKEGEVQPTREAIIDAFHAGRQETVEAYVDITNDAPFIENMPKVGKIVKEKELPMFGAKVWTLSNGAKVYVKKTDFNENEICIDAFALGGSSLNANKGYPSMKFVNEAIAVSGIGSYSHKELKKALSGKSIKLNCDIGINDESVSVTTAPNDLETAMQLLYLTFTDIRPDTTEWNVAKAKMIAHFRNDSNSPRSVMGDSIHANVYAFHPMGVKENAEMLNASDYDAMLAIHRDRFADASEFDFFFTGNYDEAKLRKYVEQYIASLPSLNRKSKPADIGYGYVKGEVKKHFSRKMENPQSITYNFWNGKCDYTLKNFVIAKVVSQALRGRYLKEIREERGWTYSVNARISILSRVNGDDGCQFIMPVYCVINPGHQYEAVEIVQDVVRDFAKNGIGADALNKAKQYLSKVYAESSYDNDYWSAMLNNYAINGLDFHTDYLKTLNSITDKDIIKFFNKYIVKSNHIEMVMSPEE